MTKIYILERNNIPFYVGKTLQEIKDRYFKIYGYTPTDDEIYILYAQGELRFLTDEIENEIIKYFNF
jgi:hypothetical protein